MSKNEYRLVYGWGINDVDYNTHKTEVLNGCKKTVWVCPYYSKWKKMIERCFCPKMKERQPTYKDCTVTEDWRYLSNFIKWIDSQPNRDWVNCDLDKDIISQGNRHYSPDTVVFTPKKVNRFIIDRRKARGDCMLGVSCVVKYKTNPYLAKCNNPFNGCQSYIGRYPTELEAHKAWQAKKHEYACQLADLQEDERVAKALRERYAPDKDWTNR